MTEIDLIRVVLLFGVFRMIWKCFHKFPQEYFHETSYFLLYTFSYSCFIISFLVLLFITKISVILRIVEFNMFLGICLMLGASGIGILEAIKKKAILDYKNYGIKLENEYKNNIIRRNFLIVIEAIMIAIVIALKYSLLGVQ